MVTPLQVSRYFPGPAIILNRIEGNCRQRGAVMTTKQDDIVLVSNAYLPLPRLRFPSLDCRIAYSYLIYCVLRFYLLCLLDLNLANLLLIRHEGLGNKPTPLVVELQQSLISLIVLYVLFVFDIA